MAVVPMLSLLIALPLVGAVLLLLLGNREGERDRVVHKVALGISLAELVGTLWLWAGFDPTRADFQFVERVDWIPSFGIQYAVGVDGISLFLVVLTGVLTPLALLCSWESVLKKVTAFCAFMLVLESAMIGVFLSLDMFLFYIFWDAMLIPMYFLIGVWGYDRRVYAAVKFILYTMAGSVLMLVAILGLAWTHAGVTGGTYSFSYEALLQIAVPYHLQFWFFLAFALAFAIKVPLFPFHTWLRPPGR
jgi:NADH-quinone oxidoreductase subunit M